MNLCCCVRHGQALLASCSDGVASHAIADVSRFWTLFEAWSSMKKVTAEGVRSAKGDERRFTIRCIHNADANFSEPLLLGVVGDKTPEEMYRILASPDVQLTNEKDKESMLPVVAQTNGHAREMFQRGRVRRVVRIVQVIIVAKQRDHHTSQ